MSIPYAFAVQNGFTVYNTLSDLSREHDHLLGYGKIACGGYMPASTYYQLKRLWQSRRNAWLAQ